MNLFCSWFGLEIPILQAPIGSTATIELASEVGRAGGMGGLALTWESSSAATRKVNELKERGTAFFVNFVLHFDPANVLLVADLRPPAITLSWGIDSALINAIQQRGVRVGVQVGSLAGAREALQAGADFVIAQGVEAGGHVQSTTPLYEFLAAAVDAAEHVPVVAAGGISTSSEIARAMHAGAQAVMLGSRYVATSESAAHDAYKDAIVKAAAADTVFTNCFDIGWPYAMHRVIRNDTFSQWEAVGSPPSPRRPGEGDVVATHGATDVIRYSDTPPLREATGNPLDACLYAGTSVEGINSIEPAFDLTVRMWDDASTILRFWNESES